MKRCNEINLSCISEQENRVISSGLSHHQVPAGDTCTEKHISNPATHYTHYDDASPRNVTTRAIRWRLLVQKIMNYASSLMLPQLGCSMLEIPQQGNKNKSHDRA